MPVTDQTTSNSSTGNGVTTVYPYTYKILDEADILVEVDGVAKTLTTHYTVSGVGVSGGGNVTFVTAPASGAVVVLSRSMAYSRDTDYQESGDLLAATLDEDVDRVTMLVQQVRQLIRRAVKLPNGVTADQVLGTGNTAAERASKLIGFDSDGDPALFTVADLDPSLVTAFIATLFDDADAETARTTLGLPDVSQAEAEAGTGTSVRAWTPERVAQAIAALSVSADYSAVVPTTSGKSFDFAIPAGVRRIKVAMSQVSTNGLDAIVVRIGDAGGVESSGYAGMTVTFNGASSSVGNFNSGYIAAATAGGAGGVRDGVLDLYLLDPGTNLWVVSGVVGDTGIDYINHVAGRKALSAELTTVRFTTSAGSDDFDGGSINVSWE